MVRIFYTPDMCLGSLNKGWTTPVGRERSQTAPSVGHARKTVHWLPPNFVVAGEYVATCSTTPLTGVDFRHIYHVLEKEKNSQGGLVWIRSETETCCMWAALSAPVSGRVAPVTVTVTALRSAAMPAAAHRRRSGPR